MRNYKYVNDKVYRWGEHEQGAIDQIVRCAEDESAYRGALMGDGHKGYSMPVGGVLAHHDMISPSGVGYDIGCGNKAVRLDVKGVDVLHYIYPIMDDVVRSVSFGVGRANNETVDHELFDHDTWGLPCIAQIGEGVRGQAAGKDKLKNLAREQLGTVGSGNHYVDIFVDENDDVWVGVHFGSRGLGHKIADWFMTVCGGSGSMDSDPVLIDVNTPLGQDYIACMTLAGHYAYAGRDWVCNKVASIIGGNIVEEVHNHHNFAWLEEHDGHKVWVVRKGATPAFPGQKGFVGGSMADNAVILEGIESEESKLALYSTVHGAGRVLGRMQAKGKFKKIKDDEGNVIGYDCVREPMVKKEDMMERIREAGVVLRGGGVDESPHCYKKIDEVLAYHSNTVKILHTLTPIGVAMAGPENLDPYKD